MSVHKSDRYARVWEAVRRIPKGRVATYGGIAGVCGFPRHARLVGYALHNLPHGSGIPWHRVVNAQGKISLPKHTGQYQKQMTLLEKEGIVFFNHKINLSLYRWPKVKSRASVA